MQPSAPYPHGPCPFGQRARKSPKPSCPRGQGFQGGFGQAVLVDMARPRAQINAVHEGNLLGEAPPLSVPRGKGLARAWTPFAPVYRSRRTHPQALSRGVFGIALKNH